MLGRPRKQVPRLTIVQLFACFLCEGHIADLIFPRVIVRVHQEGIMIPFLTPEYNIPVDLMSMMENGMMAGI